MKKGGDAPLFCAPQIWVDIISPHSAVPNHCPFRPLTLPATDPSGLCPLALSRAPQTCAQQPRIGRCLGLFSYRLKQKPAPKIWRQLLAKQKGRPCKGAPLMIYNPDGLEFEAYRTLIGLVLEVITANTGFG